MERRQAGCLRDFVERHRARQIGGEPFAHRVDAGFVRRERRRSRKGVRMAHDQRRQRIEHRRFGGERIVDAGCARRRNVTCLPVRLRGQCVLAAGLHHPVRQREPRCQVGVANHVGRKPRRILRAAGDRAGEFADEIDRHVADAIAPALVGRTRPRMHFAGIDHGHGAGFCDMAAAAIGEAFRAFENHGDRIRVVPVGRERVVAIGGRDEIRIRQQRRAPVACGVGKAVGGHDRARSGRTDSVSLARPAGAGFT